MISGSSSSPPRRSHRAPKLVDRRLLDHRLPGHERGIGLRRARPPQGLVDRIPRCPQLCDVDRPHHRHPRAQRPLLERGKFKSIVELIDTQCRAFERTPTAYPNLSEEALRALRIPAASARRWAAGPSHRPPPAAAPYKIPAMHSPAAMLLTSLDSFTSSLASTAIL